MESLIPGSSEDLAVAHTIVGTRGPASLKWKLLQTLGTFPISVVLGRTILHASLYCFPLKVRI